LPNAEQAITPVAKLRDYLLDEEHPDGGPKAVFFLGMGFRRKQWQQLEAAIRADHLTQDAQEIPRSRFGRKFQIVASLTGPNGRRAIIKSIWIILDGEEVPRLLTAYPE
jgi:filamentous hemagglutinin